MKRLGPLALLALLPCCGRQPLDLLVPAEREDPCLAFKTQADCSDNAALGCSYQPNDPGCQSSDPNCLPGMCRSGDPFVRQVGRSFLLNGEPFRFAGVSSWALLQPAPCATVKASEREAWVEGVYDALVPARAKVARFFAFQSSAGPTGLDYTLFDAAVRGARRAGVRLQFVIDDGDGGCSSMVKHDAAWYASGYQMPEGSYPLSYGQFAENLATRYRDEPTVLGYLMIQGLGDADGPTLQSFVTVMGQRLHGIAPNQLISIDLDWGSASADDGALFKQLQSLPAVDFMDVDDYTFKYPPKPMDPQLLAALDSIDKPAVVGEGAFGLLGGDAAALAARGEAAAQRIQEWRGWGFSGALLWAYQPGWSEVSEEFDARPGDPLLAPDGVLANAPW
ncbi:MAG TPA: hypothetical protein VHB79_35165 [Polyangiaceae bacterium]|nr:hypothetical protein [Polyangiaceae bacterium]